MAEGGKLHCPHQNPHGRQVVLRAQIRHIRAVLGVLGNLQAVRCGNEEAGSAGQGIRRILCPSLEGL